MRSPCRFVIPGALVANTGRTVVMLWRIGSTTISISIPTTITITELN